MPESAPSVTTPSTAPTPEPGATRSPQFHDIKSPPEFSPIPWRALLLTALILLFLFFVNRLRQLRAKSQREIAERPLLPFERALEELGKLELLRRDHRITLRELTSLTSVTLRTYLGESLAFPAAEQTVPEVTRSFRPALLGALPGLSNSLESELSGQLRQLLRFLEKVSFANDSADRFHLDSSEVVTHISQAEAFVRKVEHLLQEERARLARESAGER